ASLCFEFARESFGTVGATDAVDASYGSRDAGGEPVAEECGGDPPDGDGDGCRGEHGGPAGEQFGAYDGGGERCSENEQSPNGGGENECEGGECAAGEGGEGDGEACCVVACE